MNNKILLADDSIVNQLLIRRIVENFDFFLESVSNGNEAIEKCKTNQYAVILLDYQMPECNGIEAIKIIKNTNNLNQDTRIFFFSSETNASVLNEARALGAIDFIPKPYTKESIINVLQKHNIIVPNSTIFKISIEAEDNMAKTMFEEFWKKEAINEIRQALKELKENNAEKGLILLHKILPNFHIAGYISLHDILRKHYIEYQEYKMKSSRLQLIFLLEEFFAQNNKQNYNAKTIE